jgi:CRP-like cAMP-binding protein
MNDFFSYAPSPGDDDGGAPQRPLLADLTAEEWDRFAAFAARRSHGAGSTVVALGQHEPALYIVAGGRLVVETRDGRRGTRSEGEMFGVLSFLDGAPSDARVSVAEDGPAEVLMLTPEALQRLAAWSPRIAIALLKDLGAHVAARARRLQAGD